MDLGIYGFLPNLEDISSKEGVHWQKRYKEKMI
jgi:hypothetical protein